MSRPEIPVPSGSWDTATHIYGDPGRFPLTSERKLFLPDTSATVDELVRVHDRMGIERGVLVQATSYGPDHHVLLDALRSRPGRFAGVAVVSDQVDDRQLRELDEAGVCGARFNLCSWTVAEPMTIDEMLGQIDRIRPLGWHVALHLDAPYIVDNVERLRRIEGVEVCVDHLGHFDWRIRRGHPAFDALTDLMRHEGWWIRLSNADRGSAETEQYLDMAELISTLVEVAPDRAVWGTDWPHVYYKKPRMVDDGAMLDLLARAVPDEATRTKILVDNPRRLYHRR